MIYVGTAGWTIPKQAQELFKGEGTHLERYARTLNCVEINSSFYKPHKPETYAKWAGSVGADFRFSVKLHRQFTQEHRLKETGSSLTETLEGISPLREKWAVLLVQLPPSLEFDYKVTAKFLKALRAQVDRSIAWEPRHISWSSEKAVSLLEDYQISKVLADPEPAYLSLVKRKRLSEIVYFRLHGSPEIYKSKYSQDVIARVSEKLTLSSQNAWCIFDNTTFGHATENAVETLKLARK